ncbi:hypothetical protein EDB85DRAFT_2002368 [Lactarius pseudohatsudake]|nr:hypothetical protein EDB85DRAFT_2002368 [Lactarius pseudohatsudake]
MKWIDPLVLVLHTFSETLCDGVSLVLITNLIHNIVTRSEVDFEGVPSQARESNPHWNWRPPRSPCSCYPFLSWTPSNAEIL